MRPLTEDEIRASFVNCSKGEAQRAWVPHDLDERPWEDLDFFGWRDPGAPDRTYLVAERGGRLAGLSMRLTTANRGFLHRSLCSLCLTTHPSGGVSLMTARKAGPAGRDGNSVGLYICTDLACSLYVRGRKTPKATLRVQAENLTQEELIARTLENLTGFLDRLEV
jgi:hypothetical protein